MSHAVEMSEILHRSLRQSVWIPLMAREEHEVGQASTPGFVETYEGIVTVAFPLENKAEAMEVEWRNVGVHSGHRPYVEDGEFTSAECFFDYNSDVLGTRLVFEQFTTRADGPRVLIHPDLILGLGLIQQGDDWVAPEEKYTTVIRVKNDAEGHPIRVEIRAEHLKDFLCARGMGLAVYSFRSRFEVSAGDPKPNWPSTPYEREGDHFYWVGNVIAIDHHGMPYDQESHVMQVIRTDFDSGSDVPELGFPTPGGTASRSRSTKPTGPRFYRLSGELWRTEWLDPAERSPRVGGDPWPEDLKFISGAAGELEGDKHLIDGGKWLWFRPEVIPTLLANRNSSIEWFTRDTGRVSGGPQMGVVFGVNDLGFVNVYAKDVVLLPYWQQREWRAHNIAPEGGVSKELLETQAVGQPAGTQAPEAFLQQAIDRIRPLSRVVLGFELFHQHQSTPDILRQCHRFRATSATGLLALAKDLARLTVDAMDAKAMNRRLGSPKPALGSLKALERTLQEFLADTSVQLICGPLFGIYELRLADAHLPSGELLPSLQKAGINDAMPHVLQGRDLLDSCVTTLWGLGHALEKLASAHVE
jgi:hypothetical protein